MKRLALFTTVVLAVVIGAVAIWQMRNAVLLFALAVALGAGLTPTVERLIQRGLRRPAAVALTYGGMLSVLILGIVVFGPLAYSEVALGISEIPAWYDQTRRALIESDDWRGNLGEALPTTSALAASFAANQLTDLSMVLFGITSNLVIWGILLFSVITLSFYWLLEQQRFERLWLSLLPLQVRVSARAIWAQIHNEVSSYIRGEAIIVMLTVLSLTSVYTLLDIPGAVVLSLLGGIAQVVPLLGLPIAIFPAVVVALTKGTSTAILTLATALLVLSIIKLIIAPRVFRGSININPVLVIFLIMVLANTVGVFMILFAPPLAAALQVGFGVITSDQRSNAARSQVSQLHTLQERLAEIEARIEHEQQDNPKLQDMLTRAKKLVADTRQGLPDEITNNEQQRAITERGLEVR